ncbi:hypothetical protein ACF08W_28910 [Streptomyces sp. NPDC015144]|uniref:hypothetical protein n=1 Tax=Streptomyces sp. NPDC015144 TaxID=3364944 RepID=UPI0036F4EC43
MAKHTAVLAAVVAAVSLAITAWGTYKAAQVADDQLSQSREDGDKEKRAQASRVNAWAEGQALVTANRSLDPVVMSVFLNSAERRKAHSKMVTYVYFGVVPPCTSVQIPRSVVYTRAAELTDPPGTDWRIRGLHFVTSDGTFWVRWNFGGGRLSETKDAAAARREGDYGLIADKRAKLTRLTECGSAAK